MSRRKQSRVNQEEIVLDYENKAFDHANWGSRTYGSRVFVLYSKMTSSVLVDGEQSQVFLAS